MSNTPSAETRAKISERLMGHEVPQAVRDRISQSLKLRHEILRSYVDQVEGRERMSPDEDFQYARAEYARAARRLAAHRAEAA
jgi:hypothetical protein